MRVDLEYRGLKLDRFQEEAIGHLMQEHSVLVAAPTGTGKTLVADWIVDDALSHGKRVIYTAPIKALSNQKFRDYSALHGEEKVGLVTGDLVIRRDAPCLVMTTEILRNMLLGGEKLEDLRAVVIDEVHFLDDRERGTVWEEVLIYLPQHVLIVALSATLPNLDQFSAWMSFVRNREVAVITETQRAVPLDFHFATLGLGLTTPAQFAQRAAAHRPTAPVNDRSGPRGRGRDRGRKDRYDGPKTPPHEVVRMISDADGLPMLYFVFSRHDAERFAKSLAFRFRADFLTDEEKDAVTAFLLKADIGPALDDEVRDMYLRGIASHHAGLHVSLKLAVEQLYEHKLIKVLFCTSTFALGINMPARSVAFHGVEKYDGEEVRPLPVRGFMQKAGRAGRRGMDEAGHVVVRMDLHDFAQFKPVIQRYFDQAYEPVRSSFNLSWNSVVNLIGRHDMEHVRSIVGKSFMSWTLAEQASAQLAKAEELERAAEDGSKGAAKEARRLRKRAETADDRCWDELMAKRQFLESIGYLTEDNQFRAGARVLTHLQIAEIFVTELILSGILEDLDTPGMFAVLCALTNDMPRNVTLESRVDRHDREMAEKLREVRMSAPVVGAEAISKVEVTFCPQMMPLGRAWADGKPLEQVLMMISSPTDWSGTLITGFRRAKDLAGQIMETYNDVPQRRDAMRSLLKAVSRDEVEVVD